MQRKWDGVLQGKPLFFSVPVTFWDVIDWYQIINLISFMRTREWGQENCMNRTLGNDGGLQRWERWEGICESGWKFMFSIENVLGWFLPSMGFWMELWVNSAAMAVFQNSNLGVVISTRWGLLPRPVLKSRKVGIVIVISYWEPSPSLSR